MSMLPIALAGVLFVLLLVIITVYGYKSYVRPSRVYDQVGGATAEVTVVQAPTVSSREKMASIIGQIGEKIPLSPGEQEVLRKDLSMAGYRSDSAVATFYGIRVIAAIAMFLFALLVKNAFSDNPVIRIVIMFIMTGFGFYMPTFGLEKAIKARQEKLRMSLPDALDMMVVAVEAGLGLDQTLQYVAKEIEDGHPELSDEMSLVGFEMRAGKRRADSLKNLAERTGEAELRKLVAILTQSDRFGTSMGESLRTHSDFMRVRRKQDAEERAAKIGVKLVFPIFIFILPAMMLVSAGPALLKMFEELFPMMQNFGK